MEINSLCIRLLLAVFLLVLFIFPANADPTVAKAGIYLLDANKLNLVTGTYDMDFYLMLSCKPNCNNINIELMNTTTSTIEQQEDKGTSRFYRIKASLYEDMNLRAFPFDHQNLTIIIEDKFLDKDRLILQPDYNKTDLDNKLSIVGWSHLNWTATTENYYYPPLSQTFSRYTFTLHIQRPLLSGFIKCILPAIFILIAGFLTLTMEPGKVVQRLSVATAALIAMVILNLGITSPIPWLSYMTYIDAFMLVNYFGLVDVLVQTIILMRLVDLHKTEKAHRLYLIFRYTTPVLWLLLQIINIIIFFH